MSIPRSFIADGFETVDSARKRRFLPGLQRPGVMIGTEGETNTGKTEFILSCPGPGIVLAVDRMFDAVLDNPLPPITRNPDFVFKELLLPKPSMAENFIEHWKSYYEVLMKALRNNDAVTIGIDGDSDTWELQRLAELGSATQIPPIMYTKVNAARRALIARLYDSGKVIVGTNKLRREFAVKKDAEGNAVMSNGKEVREETGKLIRQGFDDQTFGWHIQLRHLYKPAALNPVTKKMTPQQWGIRVLKCKSNPGLIDSELWGSDCNCRNLLELAYPNVEPAEWGFK